MASVTLIPTTSYFDQGYDLGWANISTHPTWEANNFFLSNRWLFEMPPTSVNRSKITAITLNVDLELPSYATQGAHSIDIGFTNNVSNPSSVQTCSVNVTDGTTKLTFNVAPTVDISNTWYIYLYDADYAQGVINSVTITYTTYTVCGAPTACAVSNTISNNSVTLSWSGAMAGTDNAITGYEVQRAESSNGKTWGSWATLKTVSTTATSGSSSVSPPTTAGNYYKYRVRTRGSAGSSYYSSWKESTNTLRRDHDPLPAFTDTLTAGETLIKALHMTELQNSVNVLRVFYGLPKYEFTAITAGTTSLGGWSDHVAEIRAAVDEIGKSHAEWAEIIVNCPSVEVMEQLRAVVLAI